jgi:hypothetical protein
VIAKRERRRRALVHPALLAVGRVETIQPPIPGARHDERTFDGRRRQHLTGKLRFPERLARRIERKHFAFARADHDQ